LDFNQEYSIIGEICKNVCRDPDLVDDLIQEVAFIWLQLDPVKKTRIHNSNSYRWWVARVVKQQWSSSSSPFYTKYRKRQHQEYQHYHSPVDEEYDVTPDLQWAHLQDHVRQLFPSEFNIFRSYYNQGLTMMQITEKYNVDKNFVWATLKRVRESLERRINWEINGWTQAEVSEMIAPFVGKKRLKAEERQMVLDVNYIVHNRKYNNIHDREVVNKVLEVLVSTLGL